MTYNVRGLGDSVKRRKIFQQIRDKSIDIACLQETHCTKKKHKIIRSEWGANVYFSDGENNARGTMILFKKDSSIDHDNIKTWSDNNGHILSVSFVLNQQSFTVISLYAPNKDDVDFFINLLEKVEQIDTDHIILMGDLNKCLNVKLDKKGGASNSTKCADFLNVYLGENDWFDVWRETHPGIFRYTWKRRRPLIMTRLDYILMPLGTIAKVNKCEIDHYTVSDHFPVIVDLDLQDATKGPGLWKFNNKHLCNSEYVDQMNHIIDSAKERYINLGRSQKWEQVKYEAKRFSMKFSAEKARQKRKDIIDLKKKLTTAHKKLAMINLQSDRAIQLFQK